MTNNRNVLRGLLRGSTALSAFAIAAITVASPATAQDASNQPGTQNSPPKGAEAPAPNGTTAQNSGQEIIVTGTLFRRRENNTPSPISVLSTEDMQNRGVQTVQGAIQTLAANNGPALPNSFSANGAFAAGASAVSLRGLTTNSTLVLFDGLRNAYYPLADDGTRNFVDLNTVPDEMVERVEVLRDGASATYGADAIAGVVNIITKKNVHGFSANAEAGITQYGDYANKKVSATYGYGDLDTQGFNAYITAHWLDQSPLFNRDRGYPFNSADNSRICFQGNCGLDNTAIEAVTTTSLVPVFMVRPADATNTVALGPYQFLNPATGCRGLPEVATTPAQQAFPGLGAPPITCSQDMIRDWGQIEAGIERWGIGGRVTGNLGSDTQAYLEANYEQTRSGYSGFGLASPFVTGNGIIRANGPAGFTFPPFSTSRNFVPGLPIAQGSFVLALPVYICPRGTTAPCTAANGTLNPNNPFAAQGEVARLIGSLPDTSEHNEDVSRAYRVAAGVSGTFSEDWNWDVNGVASWIKLKQTWTGIVYIQHLIDVINDGSYNFVNPDLNSQDVRNYIAPPGEHDASSKLYAAQASLSHNFFDLPGGALGVAVGGQLRYESIDDPSGNPDTAGPTERYFILNAFGTKGHRTVASAYGEMTAPIIKQLELDLSGRYDHYSSGQSAFSPKAGVVINPIKQIRLRGTWSRGFRIPSFGEVSALPTTGYVTVSPSSVPASFLAQHGAGCGPAAAQIPNCSPYITQYTIGETTIANPNLKPEKSRNITAGIEVRPIPQVRLTVDYYNIKKTGAITNAAYTPALNAYYAGQPIPPGYQIIPDAPDPAFPAGQPRVAFVSAPFINANTVKTDGWDFGADLRFRLPNGWRYTGIAEAEYIHKLETIFPDGHTERYDGTLGNFNLTAGSGTPKWKGTWQNTLDWGSGSWSVTAYYTAGYDLSAMDQGTGYKDCGLSSGIQPCHVKSFIDVDMNWSFRVQQKFTFYVDVLNVFNRKPPLDTVTYGGWLYNPVVADQGIIGRMYRAGVRVKI